MGEHELTQWWQALSPAERAAAQRARKTGRLSADLAKSLQRAGVLDRDKPAGGPLPGEVERFLKARH
jgi:hypothetical protein